MVFILDEHTGVLIKKAARLFERVANMNLDELGVTYAQTIFLVRLWEQDGLNQMQLTKSSGLAQPSVVRILERMEKENLITRIRSKEDKRCYHFFLTAKAKKACRKLEHQGESMQAIAKGKFSQKKMKQINHDLLQIIDNLQAFIANDGNE